MAFQIACIREMGGGHVTSSESVKLRIAITMPGIMERNICVAVRTYVAE